MMRSGSSHLRQNIQETKLLGRPGPQPQCSCLYPDRICAGSALGNTRLHPAPQLQCFPSAPEMIKEEHEVAVLGAPQSQAPMATTVINIRSDTAVPDHIVWSLFNTIFMNWCCLGFVAFAYSVKVGGHLGCLQESVWEPGEGPAQMAHALGSPRVHGSVCMLFACVCCVCVRVCLGDHS